MKGWMAAIGFAVVIAGCDKKEGPAPLVPPSPPSVKPKAGEPTPPLTPPIKLPRTETQPRPPGPPQPPLPAGEPERILVQHVLIAFKGAANARANVTRTHDEAKAFANEILERARNGEDIKELAKKYSTDPGGGLYTLVNYSVTPKRGEIRRQQFIKPFTEIAFKLKVGEVGLAEYDVSSCPYGWHIIKRLE